VNSEGECIGQGRMKRGSEDRGQGRGEQRGCNGEGRVNHWGGRRERGKERREWGGGREGEREREGKRGRG